MATKLINPCSPCRYGYTGIEQCKVCVNIAKTFGNPIPVPPGHTAKIENNTVIFELKKAKFKKGDFVIGKDGKCMAIFKESINRRDFCEYFGIAINKYLTYYDGEPFGSVDNYRLMTDSEKQILLDNLHEAGKDWDAEKLEIVDWVWRPKAGDSIWSINAKGLINEWTFFGRGSFVPDPMDFRTPELAEAALESLKQSKHY